MFPVLTRWRRAWHRRRSRYWFVSFPKSGRTWTKQVVESYLSRLTGLAPFDYETHAPLLRTGAARAIPRIVFVHPHCRETDPRPTLRFIAGLRRRRVILLVRDPRDTVVSYWYRLRERMRDESVKSLQLYEFASSPRDGIPRIIEFLNTWLSAAENFERMHVVRFEDLKAAPMTEFPRLLAFLGVPVHADLLASVLASVPDTTTTALESRDAGTGPADHAHIASLMEGLDPALGYGAPGTHSPKAE